MAAVVHEGVTCDGCKKVPIVGIRYKCGNCADFDLCEVCENRGGHTAGHIFLKIRDPLSHVESEPLLSHSLYPAASKPKAPVHTSPKAVAKGRPKAAAGGVGGLPSATTDMGLTLFQHLCNEEAGDVFISPLSIEIAMCMALIGATEGSTTLNELRTLLGLDHVGDEATVLRAMHAIITGAAAADPKVKFLIANSTWSNGIDRSFVEACQRHFEADAFPLTGVEPINSWCAEKTQGLIKQILARLPSPCPAVLVNAVYFKGAWQKVFDEEDTVDDRFKLLDGNSVPCKMMYQHEKKTSYFDAGNAHVVQLGYGSGERFAGLIILPKKAGAAALAEVVHGFTLAQYKDAVAGFSNKDVILRLPRFKMEYGVKSLKDSFIALGARAPFAPNAGFLRMCATMDDLYIADVLHKAVCEVNEEGTVAAAVTAVVMGRGAAPRRDVPIEVTCDRPFLFVVHDKVQQGIHFIGRVTAPTLEGIGAKMR